MGEGGGVEGAGMAEEGNIFGQSLTQGRGVLYGMICFQHHAIGMQVSEEVTEEVFRFL